MTRIDLLFRGVKFKTSIALAAVSSNDRNTSDSAQQHSFIYMEIYIHKKAQDIKLQTKQEELKITDKSS